MRNTILLCSKTFGFALKQSSAVTAFLAIMATTLTGCATRSEGVSDDSFMRIMLLDEQTRYEKLSREPIPLPQTTPYDGDPKKRAAYITGFLDSWHHVIGSDKGLRGTPTNLTRELQECWSEGWLAGGKLGGESFMRELRASVPTSAPTNTNR